jgi:preprotein translocase subunit SecE
MSEKQVEINNEVEKQHNPIFNYLPIVFIIAGLGVFYGVQAASWIKWVGFIASIVIALGVFYFLSPVGVNLHKYFKESYREIQKVVWPTRKETMQFTWIVFLFVIILGLFLWAVDSGLAWILYGVILGKGS